MQDLVATLDLHRQGEIPVGIERTQGMCENREGSGQDVAFKITQRAVASIPTADVFQDEFPSDFSILTTFRTSTAKRKRSKATLFSIYSSEGIEVLSLKISRRLRLVELHHSHGCF